MNVILNVPLRFIGVDGKHVIFEGTCKLLQPEITKILQLILQSNLQLQKGFFGFLIISIENSPFIHQNIKPKILTPNLNPTLPIPLHWKESALERIPTIVRKKDDYLLKSFLAVRRFR